MKISILLVPQEQCRGTNKNIPKKETVAFFQILACQPIVNTLKFKSDFFAGESITRDGLLNKINVAVANGLRLLNGIHKINAVRILT